MSAGQAVLEKAKDPPPFIPDHHNLCTGTSGVCLVSRHCERQAILPHTHSTHAHAHSHDGLPTISLRSCPFCSEVRWLSKFARPSSLALLEHPRHQLCLHIGGDSFAMQRQPLRQVNPQNRIHAAKRLTALLVVTSRGCGCRPFQRRWRQRRTRRWCLCLCSCSCCCFHQRSVSRRRSRSDVCGSSGSSGGGRITWGSEHRTLGPPRLLGRGFGSSFELLQAGRCAAGLTRVCLFAQWWLRIFVASP